MDEQDEDRNFNERADDRGESDWRCEAEGRDGDSDRELEIVSRRREGDRRGARIIGLDQLSHPEADDELDNEIDGQRDCYPHGVAGDGHDLSALEAEHLDNGKEKRDTRNMKTE